MFQNLHRINCNDVLSKNNNTVMSLHTMLMLWILTYVIAPLLSVYKPFLKVKKPVCLNFQETDLSTEMFQSINLK